MGKGFAKKKKQAKLIQDQFSQLQEQMTSIEAEGSAGNGLVSIKLNGDNAITEIKIKEECVDPEDIEGLEDLIKEAHNKAQEALQSQMPEMPSMPGGLGGLGAMGNLGF